MKEGKHARQGEQEQGFEEAYRRGYHHGFFRARALFQCLVSEGMPPGAAGELCRVFEEEIIQPWRVQVTSTSSAPPLFSVEECQSLLREEKEHQSAEPLLPDDSSL